MTVIRLDAATLAQFQAAKGEVILADEKGKPAQRAVLSPVTWTEPTEEELQAAESDPVTYTLDEAWEIIRRGEKP